MDVRGNKVKLSDGAEISYEKCLIATGKTHTIYMWTHTQRCKISCWLSCKCICVCVYQVGCLGTCKWLTGQERRWWRGRPSLGKYVCCAFFDMKSKLIPFIFLINVPGLTVHNSLVHVILKEKKFVFVNMQCITRKLKSFPFQMMDKIMSCPIFSLAEFSITL